MRNHLATTSAAQRLDGLAVWRGVCVFPVLTKLRTPLTRSKLHRSRLRFFYFHFIPAFAATARTTPVCTRSMFEWYADASADRLDSRQLQYHLFWVGLDRSRPA